MTVRELKEYLTSLSNDGYSDAPVVVANKNWNILKESDDICDCIFVNRKSGECLVVLLND